MWLLGWDFTQEQTHDSAWCHPESSPAAEGRILLSQGSVATSQLCGVFLQHLGVASQNQAALSAFCFSQAWPSPQAQAGSWGRGEQGGEAVSTQFVSTLVLWLCISPEAPSQGHVDQVARGSLSSGRVYYDPRVLGQARTQNAVCRAVSVPCSAFRANSLNPA